MGEWTKGRIKQHLVDGTELVDESGAFVATTFLNEIDYRENACRREADVERFVACWNAHVGDPDPAATMKEVREVLEGLVRDVQDWVDAIDNNGTGWDDWDEHYKNFAYRGGLTRAHALLAKLEGK